MRGRMIMAGLMCLLLATGTAVAQTPPGGPAAYEAGQFSISAEALVWWLKDAPAPTPLVSTGLLGASGTSVLLGGKDLDTDPNPGFRLTVGYSVTEGWGVEGSVLYVPTRSTSRTVSSSGQVGSQDLFIPFFDVTTSGQNQTFLALAGQFSGTATEEFSTNLLSAELNGAMKVPASGPWRVDALGGFRYLRLYESYTFTTSSPNVPPLPLDVFNSTDEFDATNNFYGAQLGVRARFDWRGWFASGGVKFAMGAMVQSVDISGELVTNQSTNLGAPQSFPGGYFTQPTNIGSRTRTVFAVVPEVGINIGYQITPWASVFAGYTFLYTNNVARAGQQVNGSINPTGRPAFTSNPASVPKGPAEPSFKFNSTDFWAQGINVGLAFRF